MSNKSVYIVGLLISGLLCLLSFYKYKNWRDAVVTNEKISVVVKNVDCSTGKSRSLIVFQLEKKNHIVIVDYDSCRKYLIGQRLTVLHNTKTEIFYSTHHNGTEEIFGMAGFGILFILLFVYVCFPNIFKSTM